MPILGADPEAALVSRSTGRLVPAHRLFPRATKHTPQLRYSTTGSHIGQIVRDGVLLEFNPEPGTCREGLTSRMGMLIAGVEREFDVNVVFVPAVTVTAEDLADAPEDVLMSMCNPSVNAYGSTYPAAEINYRKTLRYYGGGHMHISTAASYLTADLAKRHDVEDASWLLHEESRSLFVRMCDRYVALPLLYLHNDPDQYERRKFYGQAGEYRVQNYGEEYSPGIEYRTPGPEMWNSVPLASLAFGAYRYVFSNFRKLSGAWDSKVEAAVRSAIDTPSTDEELLAYVLTTPRFYTTDILVKAKSLAHALAVPATSAWDLSYVGWNHFIRQYLHIDPQIIGA